MEISCWLIISMVLSWCEGVKEPISSPTHDLLLQNAVYGHVESALMRCYTPTRWRCWVLSSVDRAIITDVLTKLCYVQTHHSESRSIINARINKLSFLKHIYRNFSHFGMPDVIFIDSNTKITLFWNYSAIIFKGSGTIINQINGSILVKWSNHYSVLT